MLPYAKHGWRAWSAPGARLAGLLALAALGLASGVVPPPVAAADVLILARDVKIRQMPGASARVLRTADPGDTYEIAGRKTGMGKPFYILDESGDVWVKIWIDENVPGFVRTDLAAVAREEYRPPRGNAFLVVNLRPAADGTISRDLWVVQDGWRKTQRVGSVHGRPIWASHGEWFLCQVDSNRPVKDQTVDRYVERIQRFSPDGQIRNILAAGSYPILHEARGEVYFYRDVDDRGEAVPPGLFAVGVDGGALRPVHLLPERYKFWKEDGDFFVQAPPPVLHAATNRIVFYAFEPMGSQVRFTVSLEGQFLELRRD